MKRLAVKIDYEEREETRKEAKEGELKVEEGEGKQSWPFAGSLLKPETGTVRRPGGDGRRR